MTVPDVTSQKPWRGCGNSSTDKVLAWEDLSLIHRMHDKKKKKPDAMAYACNPSSREAEKGRFPGLASQTVQPNHWVPGQMRDSVTKTKVDGTLEMTLRADLWPLHVPVCIGVLPHRCMSPPPTKYLDKQRRWRTSYTFSRKCWNIQERSTGSQHMPQSPGSPRRTWSSCSHPGMPVSIATELLCHPYIIRVSPIQGEIEHWPSCWRAYKRQPLE